MVQRFKMHILNDVFALESQTGYFTSLVSIPSSVKQEDNGHSVQRIIVKTKDGIKCTVHGNVGV